VTLKKDIGDVGGCEKGQIIFIDGPTIQSAALIDFFMGDFG